MDITLDTLVQDAIAQRAIYSLVIAGVAALLVRLMRRIVGRYVDDPARRYHLSKTAGRTAAFVAVLLIVAVWSPNLRDFVTILTVIGAGLAIAMRDMLLGVVGWLDLVFRSPYEQGDRIEVNDICGDVVDIRVLHTTLMETGGWVDADQSTGRLVHIPNAWIFQHGVYNYSQGFNFIWNEMSVTVTFRSNWREARELMLSLAEESARIVEQQAEREIRRLSRKYLVHYSILSPFVYVRVADNGVQLTLRYLCEVRKRRGTQHAITMGILDGFAERDDIDFAYPNIGVQPLEPDSLALPNQPPGSAPGGSDPQDRPGP